MGWRIPYNSLNSSDSAKGLARKLGAGKEFSSSEKLGSSEKPI
jgi:hypothetical protein